MLTVSSVAPANRSVIIVFEVFDMTPFSEAHTCMPDCHSSGLDRPPDIRAEFGCDFL